MKGTRTQPQCGFSYKVLTILQEVRYWYWYWHCKRTADTQPSRGRRAHTLL